MLFIRDHERRWQSMSDYKYSVKNTTKIEREKLRNIALSYSTLDAAEPSDDTMKLVEEYVAGNMEISDALATVSEKYRAMGLKNACSIVSPRHLYNQ